ncbi:MAG: 4Fe-4S dicluster domain-containing protein [Candidatus Zixiibacteriota bacterium]|nr:MAG: 4Fe-4S dicluster domain-containing protein [candidate division Zixibacteria bacterium]
MDTNHRKIFARADLCTGCRACEIACAVAHSQAGTLAGALFEDPPPRSRIRVEYAPGVKLPLNCRHCAEPDCLFACKAGAVSKDPQTGQVAVDLRQCVGCWMCVMVCPFGTVTADLDRGKANKCDLCAGRASGPACVEACPTKALEYR